MLNVHILQSFDTHRPGDIVTLDPDRAMALAEKRLVRIVGPAQIPPPANAVLNITMPMPEFGNTEAPDGPAESTREGKPKPRRGAGRVAQGDGSGDATVPAAGGEPL